jgi:hypothetical protein
MHRERGVRGTEASEEVVFVCSDCAFCGVASVYPGGNQLVLDILDVQEILEGLGGFVVQSLKLGF